MSKLRQTPNLISRNSSENKKFNKLSRGMLISLLPYQTTSQRAKTEIQQLTRRMRELLELHSLKIRRRINDLLIRILRVKIRLVIERRRDSKKRQEDENQ